MIRKGMSTIFIIALCAGIAPAQENKEACISSWFKKLQKKIGITAPRKNLSVNTGVAGAWRAKDESGKNKLYWKDKVSEEPVTEAELVAFKEGLAYAEAGKKAEAVHQLEEFLAKHPDCALVPDAKKSLDMLKAEAALVAAVTAQQKQNR